MTWQKVHTFSEASGSDSYLRKKIKKGSHMAKYTWNKKHLEKISGRFEKEEQMNERNFHVRPNILLFPFFHATVPKHGNSSGKSLSIID